MGLSLFSKKDMELAFEAVAISGTIGMDNADEILEALYHGPAPKVHELRLKTAMLELTGSEEARIGWERFWPIMERLHAEEDLDEATNDSMATTGTFSARELLDKYAHNQTPLQGPKDMYVMPLTNSQASGWEIEEGDTAAMAKDIRPKKKCKETKYAERLLRAGELL
jgi:hypothetical protein